jgi:hypothetical protein
MDRLSAMQVAQSNLREHQSGLEYMSVLLERAKSEIENSGFISERLRRKIFSVFCFWDYGVALGCVSAGPAGAGMKDTPCKTETANADVIAIIENRLERLGTFKEYVLERENLALDAEARSLSLPSPAAADKATPLRSSPGPTTLSCHGSAGAPATTTEGRKRAGASER